MFKMKMNVVEDVVNAEKEYSHAPATPTIPRHAMDTSQRVSAPSLLDTFPNDFASPSSVLKYSDVDMARMKADLQGRVRDSNTLIILYPFDKKLLIHGLKDHSLKFIHIYN
jgi:hypothetical protein